MAVRAYCIPRKDLDPEDPRRSERPSDEFLQEFWDMGLLLVDFLEFDRFFRRKNKVRKNKLPISKPGPTVKEQKRNYGSWLPRQIRACSNQDLAPADTNDSRAQPSTSSAFMGCNCCGITHRRQHCPNRVQPAHETDQNLLSVHARPKINPKSHPMIQIPRTKNV